MAKSKLDKLLESRNEEQPLSTRSDFDSYTREQLMQEIYDNRQQAGSDGGSSMLRNNTRAALLERAGTDWYNIDEIEPNPENEYSIDEKSIEGLAELIYESKTTAPLFLVETDSDKLRIIDGERRWRAHKLLAERYGEVWKMVPGQRFRRGELTEDDISFMLNALNIGQRAMTQSERAKGFAAVADRLMKQRETDQKSSDGRRIADIMAEQYGVSPRTANVEINIGRNLVDEGLNLLDNSNITKEAADAMARLNPERQREIAKMIESGDLEKHDVINEVKRRRRTSTRIPKTTDEYLINAKKALKRAMLSDDLPDRVLIAECRNLLDKLDPDKTTTD